MFKYLDVLKWKNPSNWAEENELLVVEDSSGIFVEVRHLNEEGFAEETTKESFEDLEYVGRCRDSYERGEDIWERYSKRGF